MVKQNAYTFKCGLSFPWCPVHKGNIQCAWMINELKTNIKHSTFQLEEPSLTLVLSVVKLNPLHGRNY